MTTYDKNTEDTLRNAWNIRGEVVLYSSSRFPKYSLRKAEKMN